MSSPSIGAGVRTADAFVFDLDGTLADTLQDISEAMNHALAAHGLPGHAAAHYRRLIGGGARELARSVLPASELAQADAVLSEFRRRYYARPLAGSTAPYPGIPELLAELTRRGVPLAVLSNKPDTPTRAIVAALFPDVPFVAVYGERPPLPRKPNPETVLGVAAELGVAPGRCAYVGDSEIDMQTAHAAGMAAVAVLWGFRDEPELRACRPDFVAAEAAELLAVCAR